MTDMDDRDHIAADPVVDDIRVPPEPEGVDTEVLDDPRAPWRVTEAVDLGLDERLDVPRRSRVLLIEVFEDRLAVSECALRIADSQMPWRLFAAATTSSGT